MAIIDLSKAFDHIPRDLLYPLLRRGGFPARILGPYRNFQERLKVFYTIGEHAGEVHSRNRSIPQGDPWSMMEMAYLMRPWILKMKSLNLKPRNLADDMFLAAEGENNPARVHEGVEITHQMVEDMASKVNIDKTGLLANSPKARKALKNFLWGLREEKVEVYQHVRDLGSHLNTVRAKRNGTMAARCKAAKVLATRLKHMPTPRTSNKLVVMGKIYPAALYAAEVVSMPVKEIAALATTVVDCFMPKHTNKRSQDVFWAVAMPGLVDPWLYSDKKGPTK